MAILPRFYVYVLARPNGKPFYVGKGTKRRVYQHDYEARSGCPCHKCNVIRKIWSKGGEVQRYIVFTTDNEQEALDYEIELIALYGRKNLTNLTDGGEGVSGMVPSPELRARLSKAIKAARSTPESRAKTSRASLGHPVSEETRAKIRAAHKGRKGTRLGATNSPEHRRKISEALKGRKQTEEQRQKNRDGHKGQRLSPETIEKIRQKNIGKKRSAEFREKMRQINLGREISPEHRRKIGETLTNRKHTPESIEKMSKKYIAILPSGEQVYVSHLKTFCEEHGLNYGSVSVYVREGRPYKGYIIRRADSS